MQSKARLFGHPIHPMLVVFPLGLLAMAVVFDVLQMTSGSPSLGYASYYMIAAGIIGGLIAAVFGFIDWTGIPAGTRARAIGALHGIGNVVVVSLFALSWLVRRADPTVVTLGAFAPALAGALLALVTGWLGGELVDRLGVGVDEGANVDAPSSLSGRPARG